MHPTFLFVIEGSHLVRLSGTIWWRKCPAPLHFLCISIVLGVVFWRRFLNLNRTEHPCCKQTHHVKVLLIYWPPLLPHDRVFKSFLLQWRVCANHFNYLRSCWCRGKDPSLTRLGIKKSCNVFLTVHLVCVHLYFSV